MGDLEGPEIDRRTTMKLMSAAGFAGLAGCTGSQDGGSQKEGGKLVMGMAAESVGRLDPHVLDHTVALNMTPNIHSGLLRIGEGGKLVGDAAKDWELVDDTTWRFQLREGMKFHNGDDLDASAVKASFELIKERTEAPHHGKTEGLEEIETPNSTTVVLNTSQPIAPLPAYLTPAPGRAYAIVHAPYWREDPERYKRQPMGSGPFKVAEIKTGEYLLLERFEDYFLEDENGNQLPYLDEIEVRLIPEANTLWSALKSGDVQYAPSLPAQFGERASNASGLNVRRKNDATWYAISFLCNKPHEHPEWAAQAGGYDESEVTDVWEGKELPTSNVKVRRALAKAIDREDLVKRGYLGWADPASHLMHPDLPWAHEAANEVEYENQVYDPEGARKLLDEAGYTGNPRFSGTLVARRSRKRAATVLQEQWSEVNVDINVELTESGEWFNRVYKYEDLMAAYFGGLVIDPAMAWRKQLHTPDEPGKGTWSKNLFSDEKFDQLLEESFTTPDQEERSEVIKKLAKRFDETSPFGVTVYPYQPEVRTPEVKQVQAFSGVRNFHFTHLEN